MIKSIKLRNKEIFLLIFFFIILKLAILFLSKIYTHQIFGGGNDSDYYDAYAIGLDNYAVNYWPKILRLLNDFGLYDREYISLFLSFLAIFIIPFMIGKLALIKNFSNKQYIVLFLFLIITIYPNIFFQSLDIYRDIFMMFIFLVGLFIIKDFFRKNVLVKIFYFVIALCIAYILFLFRPYLGFGFLVAILLTPFYSFKKYSLFLTMCLLLFLLQISFSIGFLESILKYRTIFETMDGGSNLGINFDSATFFIPKFIQSFFYQMFGLYFTNIASIIAFCIETIPFLIALVYLVKNREYSNKFVDFFIVFFIAYGVIWLLGNDNLGTATRLRMFNYLVVYISCFIVYQNKYIYQKISKGL
jgi:hypothetical protein